MATDSDVKKTVGRPQWPREKEPHTPEEQQMLEELAKAEERERAFPGTKEEVAKAMEPFTPEAPGAALQYELQIDEARVKHAFALAHILTDVVVSRLERGTDYDVIPGTQQEALLDPGASTLMNVAGVRTRYGIVQVREEDDGHVVLMVGCDLISISSEAHGDPTVVASGIGAVSTHETKYAYRWVEDQDVPAGADRALLRTRQRDTRRGPITQFRVPNPDLGDLWNTLVKMGAKRADVDAATHLPGVARGMARIRKNSR
jgi:hypothetical protein